MRYELYRDRRRKYRWRLIADNGKILAVSSEGYERKENAKRCLEFTKESTHCKVEDKSRERNNAG